MFKKVTIIIFIILFFCPFLLLANRQNSKPVVGSQIDWSNPLSRGLVGCWLMNEGGGAKIINLKNSQKETLTNAVWQNYIKGSSIYTDNDQYIQFTNKISGYGITNKMTAVWMGVVTGIATDQSGFLWGQHDNDSLTYDWGIYRSYSTQRFAFYITTATALSATMPNNSSPLNLPSMVVGTYDGANIKIYQNGIAGTITAQTGNVTNVDNFYLGYTWGNLGVSYVLMKTSYLLLFNRALSPSEIRSLYENPYQFIKPPTIWSNFSTAVAAARRIFMVQ